MFHSSLEHGGFLALGHTESLCFTSVVDDFSVVNDDARIYKCQLQHQGMSQ